MFPGACDCVEGAVLDAETKVAINKIHLQIPGEIDSNICLQQEAGGQAHLFQFLPKSSRILRAWWSFPAFPGAENPR